MELKDLPQNETITKPSLKSYLRSLFISLLAYPFFIVLNGLGETTKGKYYYFIPLFMLASNERLESGKWPGFV